MKTLVKIALLLLLAPCLLAVVIGVFSNSTKRTTQSPAAEAPADAEPVADVKAVDAADPEQRDLVKESSAQTAAWQAVRLTLDERVRHTANFPVLEASKVWTVGSLIGEPGEPDGPDLWFVTGNVEVTNAFNAKIRHPYKVVLEDRAEGWYAKEVHLSGEKVRGE